MKTAKNEGSVRFNLMVVLALFTILANARIAPAQSDIAGDWDHPGPRLYEDTVERGIGPAVGDYLGVPLSEAGILRAESYSPSRLNVPEHQCSPHPPSGAYWMPSTLTISREYDPISRRLLTYTIKGTYGIDRVIWMDGRPHPSEYEPHTFTGFSTGRWDGERLVVETSHLKAHWIRRNGTPLSDQTRMVEYFIRRDNHMVIVTVLEDPVYLSEPFIRTTDLQLNSQPAPVLGRPFNANEGEIFFKCFAAEELGGDRHRIPHYLPDANSLVADFYDSRRLPRWVGKAGAETMYPDFIRRLKQPGYQPLRDVRQPERRRNDPTTVRSIHVQGQVWAVIGGGGNVTVQIGDEGVLVVDTGVEQMAEDILEEIRKISGNKPIKYIINTHGHSDNTGGNVKIAAGSGLQNQRPAIITHENAAAMMSERNAPASTLVMDTFFGSFRNIYFNDEPIEIIHLPAAHTAGDVAVFFRKSDVLSVGDVLIDASYPIIGLEEGGTVEGAILALNRIIDTAVPKLRQQGGTMIVPGRGRIYDQADVAEYRDMLTIIRDRVRDSIRKGRTLEQVRSARPTLDYDGLYGSTTGSWTIDMFVETVYRNLSAEKQGAPN